MFKLCLKANQPCVSRWNGSRLEAKLLRLYDLGETIRLPPSPNSAQDGGVILDPRFLIQVGTGVVPE
jgi:hypothetical protein